MLLPRFRLYQPETIAEAVGLLSDGDGAVPIAGGTDLLVRLQSGPAPTVSLIDITRCGELRFLEVGEQVIKIGALTTLRQIERSSDLRCQYAALPDCADSFASVQIRNLATVGGNICNASPAAEVVPPLLIADAQVFLLGPSGTRRMAIEGFMKGPGETDLGRQELLHSVELRTPGPRTATAYLRFSPRRSMDLMTVGVAASVTLTADGGALESVALSLGAVAPTAVRAPGAEAILSGAAVGAEEIFEEAGEAAVEAAKPISDIRASADYRRTLIRVMVPRTLRLAISRAKQRSSGEE